MDLGTRVRSQRKAAGLSQVKLADKAGLAHLTISRLERGLRVPKLPTLQKIAAALGVSFSSLVDENVGAQSADGEAS